MVLTFALTLCAIGVLTCLRKKWPAQSRSAESSTGFTIIEVLIVLAIVTLILLIVFIAMPQVQRYTRNHQRQRFAELVVAQMETYKGNHLAKYPGDGVLLGTTDERCLFLQNYITDGGLCTTNSTGECVAGVARQFSVCFRDKDGGHEYIGPYDEVDIELGHICNHDPSVTDPIISAGSDDDNPNRYVVWTGLEPGDIFCMDSGF
jgi:prepilin-type N-terminal cleavage/methylation domain-containing protein